MLIGSSVPSILACSASGASRSKFRPTDHMEIQEARNVDCKVFRVMKVHTYTRKSECLVSMSHKNLNLKLKPEAVNATSRSMLVLAPSFPHLRKHCHEQLKGHNKSWRQFSKQANKADAKLGPLI